MQNSTDFPQWEKYLRKLAWKVARRLHAAGAASTQYEDVFSECCVAYCVARDHFDPNGEACFFTYLTRGVYTHVNRWAKSQIRNGVALSLDAPVSEDGSRFDFDLIEDETQTVGLEVERQDALDWFISTLPPRAHQYLKLIANPPAEVLAISRALDARTKYARQRGYPRFQMKDNLSRVIFDLMGCGPSERGRIMEVIEKRLAKREAAHV